MKGGGRMCAACGVLSGAPDWLDRVGNATGIGADKEETRFRERARMIKFVNILLAPGRTSVREFGEQLIIQSATGQSSIVGNLAHVWTEADKIGLRLVDPLDEDYLELLEA